MYKLIINKIDNNNYEIIINLLYIVNLKIDNINNAYKYTIYNKIYGIDISKHHKYSILFDIFIKLNRHKFNNILNMSEYIIDEIDITNILTYIKLGNYTKVKELLMIKYKDNYFIYKQLKNNFNFYIDNLEIEFSDYI